MRRVAYSDGVDEMEASEVESVGCEHERIIPQAFGSIAKTRDIDSRMRPRCSAR